MEERKLKQEPEGRRGSFRNWVVKENLEVKEEDKENLEGWRPLGQSLQLGDSRGLLTGCIALYYNSLLSTSG